LKFATPESRRKVMRGSLFAALAATLAISACAPSASAPPRGCVLAPLGKIGGPVSLLDVNGHPATEKTFAGRPALLYFGYTFCPDVCPMSLQAAKKALADMPASARPAPIMISLDPERDPPSALKLYVESPAFPEGLHGLTGSVEQVNAAAAAFKVFHARQEQPDSAAQYLVDHSSLFYLVDETWRTRAVFPSSMQPAQIQQCIALGLKT
jgi:protein SCO1/2